MLQQEVAIAVAVAVAVATAIAVTITKENNILTTFKAVVPWRCDARFIFSPFVSVLKKEKKPGATECPVIVNGKGWWRRTAVCCMHGCNLL